MSRYPTFLPIFPCINFFCFSHSVDAHYTVCHFEPVIKPFLLKNRKLMIEIRHAEMILFFRHGREKIRGAVVFFSPELFSLPVIPLTDWEEALVVTMVSESESLVVVFARRSNLIQT